MRIADECSSWRSMPEPERDKFWPEQAAAGAGEEQTDGANTVQSIQLPYTVASVRFQRASFMGSASGLNVKGRAAQVVLAPHALKRSFSRCSDQKNQSAAAGTSLGSLSLAPPARLHLDSDSCTPNASHRVSAVPIAEADSEREPGLLNRQVSLDSEGIHFTSNRLSSTDDNKPIA